MSNSDNKVKAIIESPIEGEWIAKHDKSSQKLATLDVFKVDASLANNIGSDNPEYFDWDQLCADDRTNSCIFFDVALLPLNSVLGEAYSSSKHQVVVNMDKETNNIIHVPKNQYTLLKNCDAYNMVMNAINKLGQKGVLNVEEMYIRDSCLYEGGRTIREIFFPKEIIRINGDNIVMRLIIVNSYDGTTNFSIQCGGFRMVCCNGIISGDRFLNLSAQHSSGLDLNFLERKVTKTVQSFKSTQKYWELLVSTKLGDAHADKILTEFSKTNGKLSLERFEGFTKLWLEHKKQLGGNYWAMLQVLTFWSTHHQVSSKGQENAPYIIYEREKKLTTFLQSNHWQVEKKK